MKKKENCCKGNICPSCDCCICICMKDLKKTLNTKEKEGLIKELQSD